jgi:hypothetical protein
MPHAIPWLRTFVFPALTLRNRLRSRLPSQAVQPLAKWLGRTQLIPRISAKNRPAPATRQNQAASPLASLVEYPAKRR